MYIYPAQHIGEYAALQFPTSHLQFAKTTPSTCSGYSQLLFLQALPRRTLLPLSRACTARYGHNARSLFLTTNLIKGGPDPNNYNPNSNTPVNPLYQLTKDEWWMQKVLNGDPWLLEVR